MTYRVTLVLEDGTRLTTWAQGLAAQVESDLLEKHPTAVLLSIKPTEVGYVH